VPTSAIIDRLGELPSLPSVYLRTHEALEDPNGSLEAVARIIETDPSLSARLLRVANSALFGLPSRVDTVMRALAIIGTTETHNLLLTTAIMTVFRDLPLGAVSMRSFWEHSLACAIAARTIARRRGSHSVEQTYMAGLLHDIGRLPMFILEPQIMDGVLLAHWERQGPLWAIEQEHFGITHADIGAKLMESWGIPALYCAAAAFHHQPGATPAPNLETAITHVSDVIVNSLRIGTSGTRWVPALDDGAWQRTGLDIADLPPIVEITISTARDVASAFLEH
jgi:putative nucleotidyltransferase with HDIG domain